jgi:hypothetical protein
MNPFPGSTRGYPKTEEELRIEAEEDDRRKKEEEKASRIEDEEEEGVEVNLEEGAGKIESADLRELMKMSGLAEGDEAEKEGESDYSDMEKYRDKLDADVAFRATEIVTGRAKRGKVHRRPGISDSQRSSASRAVWGTRCVPIHGRERCRTCWQVTHTILIHELVTAAS